ncbi:ER lumen protein-retaining receptor isoform X1 [Manihot esculenta]|uniref:ER lumen protein-retaining receptor isoform X1 n=1 Tax=Manihot esculenta TaxID=3983 RepID=UPI001CC3D981|nr:ER lumen protein-retaining receptor isoform X1 [Manihot esculenta]
MNLFRLAGDMTHLLSIVVLLLKIRNMKSCAGISLKTQELYALVFLTRYLDLFTKYYSIYNTAMKLVFIGTSVAIVWYMRYHKVVKQTYSKDEDTFRHYILILLSFVLALLIHRSFDVIEVLWAFSIYLEAVAILPQLLLLQRSRNIDNLTVNYVFLLGVYYPVPNRCGIQVRPDSLQNNPRGSGVPKVLTRGRMTPSKPMWKSTYLQSFVYHQLDLSLLCGENYISLDTLDFRPHSDCSLC